MIGVLKQAVEWMEDQGHTFDAVMLLQPTSPFRETRHIHEALHLFFKKNAETVVSVMEVPHQFNPVSLMDMRQGRLAPYLQDKPLIVRRQDKPTLYARNGPAILILPPALIKEGRLYGEEGHSDI